MPEQLLVKESWWRKHAPGIIELWHDAPIIDDDEDAEEADPSTLAGDFDPEDGEPSEDGEAPE